MENINIGIIGLGTIGKGVYEAIMTNGSLIAQRTGIDLKVKGLCDKDKNALGSIKADSGVLKTDSADEIINNDEIDIVVELVGGIDPAKDFVLKALNNKKHVVTANKALLSEHWKEIFEVASKNNVFVNFEASVGGAIPVIKTLTESFVANKIGTIYGILNGTTNFILTMMDKKGYSFDEALGIAQKEGYAESDPELDISGKDSAHKLAILSLIGFGINVSGCDVYTEGITDIAPEDLENASKWGYSIKLLAIAKNTENGVELRVHPTLLPSEHLLSEINGADNAVFIKGDLIQESLLFGKGAGSKPTSSSVIGDIVEISKDIKIAKGGNFLKYNFNYDADNNKMSNMDELLVSYYFRFSVIDQPGVLAGISSVLAENDISIANVSQEERKEGETVPVVIMTHASKEGNMKKAIQKIDDAGYTTSKTVVIRMEE